MARCHHCNRPFRNKQSVRAHLRWCAVWLGLKDGQNLVKPPPRTTTVWQCCGCGCLSRQKQGRCKKCGGVKWRHAGDL